MKKPKVIYHNNNKSNHNLVLRRLIHNKKEKSVLDLYSHFLQPLVRRRSISGSNYIKNARNIRVAGIASSFLLVLLSVSILIPIYNKTNNVEATTGTSKQSDTELSITTSSNIAGVDLLVTDNNGTFASSDDSGNTLGFNVTTNNYTGYTLTIASPDTTTYNDGKLTNTDTTNCTDTTKCVLNTISKASNTITTNGTWGYKPSKLNSATNSNYLPSPTTTATTLDKTTVANTTDTYNTYTIGLAARADYTQPAGVYSNTYVLQATGNPVNYAITYNKNTTDTVTNMPTYSGSNTQSGSTSDTEIDVSTTVPVRTNYTFLGWCDTATTTVNNTDSCSGTIYNVNGAGTSDSNLKYGIDQTTTNITTFYAMWKLNGYTITAKAGDNITNVSINGGTAGTTVSGVYPEGTELTITAATSNYLSTWTNSTSNGTMTKTDTKTIKYIVGAGATTITAAATTSPTYIQDLSVSTCNTSASSTNVIYNVYDRRDNSDYSVRYINGACWMTQNLRITASKDQPAGTILGEDSDFSAASISMTDDTSFNSVSVAQYHELTDIELDDQGGIYTSGQVGVWYSFCAAAAMSGTGACANSTYTGTESICPAGWRLPTYSTDGAVAGNIYGLRTSYSSVNASAFSPVYGGFYMFGALYQATTDGYWWSSTAGGAYGQYLLHHDNSSLDTTTDGKFTGFYVRCVMESRTIADVTYMQDVTPAIAKNTAVGATAVLKDSRDEQSYTVGKLADGNVWLLDNLALDITDSAVQSKLNSTTTNATNDELAYLLGTKTGTTSDKYATSGVTKNWTSGYSYSAPWIAVDSSTSGLCNNAHCVNTDKSWSYSNTLGATINGTTSIYQGKIGVYYNYCAASAGTYCYGNGTSYGSPPANSSPSGDICPAGWRMPTSGSSGEYQTLYSNSNYNTARKFQAALHMPLSGYFVSGKAYAQGNYGYFWSSTYNNTNNMYRLYVDASSVGPATHNGRYVGNSVRCVLQ